MKKIFFVVLISFCFTGVTNAQEQNNITGNFYVTNIDIPVFQFDFVKGKAMGQNTAIARRNTKFTAYKIEKDKLVVKFWDYSDSLPDEGQYQPLAEDQGTLYISQKTNGKYFLMEMEDFNKMTAPYFGSKHSVVWGFSTIPIKLRFKNESSDFDFETGFTLGVNAGYEYSFRSRKEQAIAFLTGFGVSTVEVSHLEGEPSTSGAFTPSLGVLYAYENFQVGLFLGKDFIGGSGGDSWGYNGKTWLGIGMGFTIFQQNKTNTDSKNNQNKSND